MPGLDKEEGCVVQFSYTCVYFRSFPRSRLTWVNNCEEGTPTGSFPNHKGFIKSSAAAEIMTHNYLIPGLFVGSDWTSSCDALLESKLGKQYSCMNVMTWNETCYETLQNWLLLNDRSCGVMMGSHLPSDQNSCSPSALKESRVQGFFILYHYIYLYLYSLYLIRDVSGVLFQPAHTQCFMQRGSEGISWVDWRIGRIYLWFLYPSHAG